jgi:hypothetical protein
MDLFYGRDTNTPPFFPINRESRRARWVRIRFGKRATRNGSNINSPGMKSVKRMQSGENANPHAISPDPARIESSPIDFNSTTFRSAPSGLWYGRAHPAPGFHCISPRANAVRPIGALLRARSKRIPYGQRVSG